VGEILPFILSLSKEPKDGTHHDIYKRKFKPHSTFASQRLWRDERVNKLLGV
jgi:hypothetical protein